MKRKKLIENGQWVQGAFTLGTIPASSGEYKRFQCLATGTRQQFGLIPDAQGERAVRSDWEDYFHSIYMDNLEITTVLYMKAVGNRAPRSGLTCQLTMNVNGSPTTWTKKTSTFTCTGQAASGGSEYFWQCYTYLNLNGTIGGGNVAYSFGGTWTAKDLVGTEHSYHWALSSTKEVIGTTSWTKEWGISGEATVTQNQSVGGKIEGIDISEKVSKGIKIAATYSESRTVTTPVTAPVAINNYDYRVTTRGYLNQGIGQSENRERWVGMSLAAAFANTSNAGANEVNVADIKTMIWGTEVIEMIIAPYLGDLPAGTPDGYQRPVGSGETPANDKEQDAVGDAQDVYIPSRWGTATRDLYVSAGATGAVYYINFGAVDDLECRILSVSPLSEGGSVVVMSESAFSSTIACRVTYLVTATGSPGAFAVPVTRTGDMPEGFEGLESAELHLKVIVHRREFALEGLETCAGHAAVQLPDTVSLMTTLGESIITLDFGGPLGQAVPIETAVVDTDIVGLQVDAPVSASAGDLMSTIRIAAASEGQAVLRVTTANRSVLIRVVVSQSGVEVTED